MKRLKVEAANFQTTPATVEAVPIPLDLDALPSDALPFNDVIEQRFRQLFTLCTDPKDLTAALKAATDFVKVKGEVDSTKGWGSQLSGTMR